MESLKALDTYDTELKIHQYLEKSEQSVPCERSAELSLTARLCSESLDHFQGILLCITKADNRLLPRPEYISLERSFSQFKLWSDGYGVSNGELDGVLDRSKRLRRDIMKLLQSIGITLTERLLPQLVNKSSMTESLRRSSIELKAILEAYHHDHDDDESTSSDGSANSLEDNVQEMTKDLQTDTLCLMELGDLLKDPVLDSIQELEKLAQHEAFFTWEPHQAFCDKVETRFPGVEEPLVLRLGKANYERYIRCQKERETQEQTVSTEGPENPALQVVLDGSMFHDSGLGSSMPSAAPYAETLMSYGSARGSSVQVPALPAEGKAGKSFACFVCGKTVSITNNSAWKRHLYSDLQPWLCLDLSCSRGDAVFKDLDDWTSHLALDHRLEPRWESFECPLCHAETGTGKVTITRHLGAHLEEISLGALPINVDCKSDSESTLSQPSPQLQPQTPQDAASLASLRFSRHKFPVPGSAEAVPPPPEPAFQVQTNIFKQSYYNTAHYNNPHFQPEEYKPEEEDIPPTTRIAGRKKADS